MGRGRQLATRCFSTLGCGELELEDALQLAVRRNLPAIELRTLGGRNELPDYFDTRYGTPERLADLVETYGVEVVSLDSSCRAIGTSQAGRVEVEALAPWAAAIGAPAIRIFDGGEAGDDRELDSVQALLDWWQQLGAAPELIVETHDALARPTALQRFIDRYPAAGILWDTHHTWREGGESPRRTWARVRGHTRHLHLKDSDIDGKLVPPGAGTFPFHELLETLTGDGFAGVLSLEWERHWHPDLPPIGDALDGYDKITLPFRSRLLQ